MSDRLPDLIDETIEALPLAKKIEIARMDGGEIWILQRRLGRYLTGIMKNDLDYLPSVVFQIWERLKRTYRLRIVK